MTKLGLRVPMVAVLLTLAGCAGVDTVETTYEWADVRIAGNVVRQFGLDFRTAYENARSKTKTGAQPNFSKARLEELTAKLPGGAKLPVIVYLHGCAGIRIASRGHLEWLAGLDDFVVVAPDSFARQRPSYCFADYTVDVSLHRQVAAMRRAEVVLALERVAREPWADTDNIFLVGHSQGGGLAAGYRGPVEVRGRILINGSCNDSLGGNGIGDDEAVLSFDTGRDPWFQRYTSYCRSYARNHPNGRSIYDADSRSHNLVVEYWPVVSEFLARNRR